MQLLLAVEEMQMQQRAENGVREKIIGYVGSDWTPEPDEFDITDIAAFEGAAYEVGINDLPEAIRDVVLAENHRLTTGEVLTTTEFKKRREVS